MLIDSQSDVNATELYKKNSHAETLTLQVVILEVRLVSIQM